MVASLPAVSLAGSEMWCRLWLQSEHFKRIYCPWCICASVIKDCKPVLFFSRDLERCSTQTLCHIVERHSPHRDQCTVVLDSKVCCKESRRCSCPSGFLCTGEMGEEPTSWRPGEWTVLRQYFQQRTDNLNLQQSQLNWAVECLVVWTWNVLSWFMFWMLFLWQELMWKLWSHAEVEAA